MNSGLPQTYESPLSDSLKSTRGLLVAIATGMLTLGIAVPASAGTTSATVTVTGGALSITVPTAAGNLGTLANTVLGGPAGQDIRCTRQPAAPTPATGFPGYFFSSGYG
jgi:hypothetical protein